jgi:hypothetical protein
VDRVRGVDPGAGGNEASEPARRRAAGDLRARQPEETKEASMAKSTIQVIDPEPVSAEEAQKVPAGQIARTLPPGPMEEKEVEGQYPYWQYYRCHCGTVSRVLLDTDYYKYFRCACGQNMFRA